MVLGIFFVGQFLEGYVLAPKLVGESVGLHPVWLMFALFAFGYLFGFVGLLIAVPLAAVIGVLAALRAAAILDEPVLYRRAGEPAGRLHAVKRAGAGPRPMSVPRQLALALPHAESFAREDFLTGASNDGGARDDRALARLARPRARADRAGRRGQEPSGGDLGRDGGRTPCLGARARRDRSASARSQPARWWSRMRRAQLDERALFHLLNLMREEEAFLLITRGRRPRRWGVALPDLASRLRAIPAVALSAPDDALLRAVLVKLFADRQLGVDESLIGYLATRIERSFAAAKARSRRSTARRCGMKRPVTRALAAELLARKREPDDGRERHAAEHRIGRRDAGPFHSHDADEGAGREAAIRPGRVGRDGADAVGRLLRGDHRRR